MSNPAVSLMSLNAHVHSSLHSLSPWLMLIIYFDICCLLAIFLLGFIDSVCLSLSVGTALICMEDAIQIK